MASGGVLDTAGSVPSPVSASPPEVMTTNAVNRSLSDLHAPTWLALLAFNITSRTLVFHPLQLAISRKRVTRSERPPSAGQLVKAAFRGGKNSFPSAPGEVYDFRRGGVRGCYRGVGAALVSNLVGEMSYLFTLELLKERLRGKPSATASLRAGDGDSDGGAHVAGAAAALPVAPEDFAAHSTPAAVGAMAGDLAALVLVTPTVVLCNRQMTAGYGMAADNAYRSLAGTLREVWDAYQDPKTLSARARATLLTRSKALSVAWWRDGVRGIYQGTSAGLLRIPSSGCWWALYTKSKEAVYRIAAPTLSRLEERRLRRLEAVSPQNQQQQRQQQSAWRKNWLLSPTDNPLLNAIAGIFAGVCTTVLFNPMAVIQTRQQSLPLSFWAQQQQKQHMGKGGFSQRARRLMPFRKVYVVAADLVRKEGPRAFFKGATANVGVAVMDGVIFSLLFEFSKLGSDTQFLEQLGVKPESTEA